MQREVRRSIISGRIAAPPSAAVAHRAIIAASLAEGQSVISNVPFSQSVMATVNICDSICADIMAEGGIADVIGGGEMNVPSEISCGESNTALKLFMGIFSHFETQVEFTGAGPLLTTSLRPFTAYLDQASAYTFNPSTALPLKIRGPIKSEKLLYFTPLGTQFLSGILLGAPLREEETEIGIAGEFQNRNCLDATIEIMKKAGIGFVATENDYVLLPGGQSYEPLKEFEVPGSKRLSSYFLLAGVLGGKCVLENMPEFSKLELLFARFKAFSSYSDGTFTSGAGALEAADIDSAWAGELLPHALVMGSVSKGDSRFTGFSRLHHRNHARARKMVKALSRMGASITEIPDGVLISGGKLHGTEITPDGDAEVAMACAIAALVADGPTTINEAECVERVCPDFFRSMVSLGAIVR